MLSHQLRRGILRLVILVLWQGRVGCLLQLLLQSGPRSASAGVLHKTDIMASYDIPLL